MCVHSPFTLPFCVFTHYHSLYHSVCSLTIYSTILCVHSPPFTLPFCVFTHHHSLYHSVCSLTTIHSTILCVHSPPFTLPFCVFTHHHSLYHSVYTLTILVSVEDFLQLFLLLRLCGGVTVGWGTLQQQHYGVDASCVQMFDVFFSHCQQQMLSVLQSVCIN